MIGLVWVCCVLGDTTSFFIGRRLGREFVSSHGPKLQIDEKRLEQVEAYFQRHGGKTILVGPLHRAGPRAGPLRRRAPRGSPFKRFIPFSVIGCGLWGTTFSRARLLLLAAPSTRSRSVAGQAALALGFVVAVVIDRSAASPAFEPSGAWVLGRMSAIRSRARARSGRPSGRSLRRAGWPGRRPLAALPLGPADAGRSRARAHHRPRRARGRRLCLRPLRRSSVERRPAVTPLDRELLDVCRDLRSHRRCHVAKAITALGSFTARSPARPGGGVIVLGVPAHGRSRRSLVVGAALLYIGVHLAKNAIDRPRPAGALVDRGLVVPERSRGLLDALGRCGGGARPAPAAGSASGPR